LIGKIRSTILFAGILIALLGIVNAIIGVISIIESSSNINVWTVVFGLLMVNAGLVCFVGGVGHIFQKGWGSRLAFYSSIIIILVSLAGVRQMGGFIINTVIAVFLMISATGVTWYLSERKLGAFFIISVAEHTIVVMVVIMLIYSGPMDAVPEEPSISVTIEKVQIEPIKPEEKFIPPKPKVKKEKKVAIENKKKETGQPVEPPKLKIKNKTDVDSGSQTPVSVPRLPKTFAGVLDDGSGNEAILRAPGPEKNTRKTQDSAPVFDKTVGSAVRVSKNPEAGIVPSFNSGKGKGGISVGKESDYVSSGQKSTINTSGSPTGASKPGFIGDIKGELAGRKVIHWPKQPQEVKSTEGGSVTLELVVDPSGSVSKVRIVEKSGNPKLDKIATDYVKQIRFEELPSNVRQIVQRGEVIINFELVR
jgi:protein TonB